MYYTDTFDSLPISTYTKFNECFIKIISTNNIIKSKL